MAQLSLTKRGRAPVPGIGNQPRLRMQYFTRDCTNGRPTFMMLTFRLLEWNAVEANEIIVRIEIEK